MALTLAKEIKTLQDFSAQTHARQCKTLNFNGYRPLIKKRIIGEGWQCHGKHPAGFISIGFGNTPEEAYINWTYDEIPF